MFARENEAKFTDLVEQEIQKLKSVKVSFGLQVKFSIEGNGKTQHLEHYFRENEPHLFNRNYEELIKQKFDELIERTKGEIENWSEKGSGWEVERIIGCVRECCTLSATTRRYQFTSSSQSGKKEGNN